MSFISLGTHFNSCSKVSHYSESLILNSHILASASRYSKQTVSPSEMQKPKQRDQHHPPTVTKAWKMYLLTVFQNVLFVWYFPLFCLLLSSGSKITKDKDNQDELHLMHCCSRLSSCRCNTRRGCCTSRNDECSTCNPTL